MLNLNVAIKNWIYKIFEKNMDKSALSSAHNDSVERVNQCYAGERPSVCHINFDLCVYVFGATFNL